LTDLIRPPTRRGREQYFTQAWKFLHLAWICP